MIGKNSEVIQAVVSKEMVVYLKKRATTEGRKMSNLVAVILGKEMKKENK